MVTDILPIVEASSVPKTKRKAKGQAIPQSLQVILAETIPLYFESEMVSEHINQVLKTDSEASATYFDCQSMKFHYKHPGHAIAISWVLKEKTTIMTTTTIRNIGYKGWD